MNKTFILLKTLLLSTSKINIYKYTFDEKRQWKVVRNFIGLFILYAMVMIYSIVMCVGYGTVGMIEAVPVMCALIISTLAYRIP